MKDLEIPKHWKWVKVSSIAELYRGITYTKDVASSIPSQNNIPILRGNNINSELNFDDLVYVPKELIKPEQLIKKDDIIFAMSSGSKHLVGKTAVAKSDFNGSYGAFCAMLRISDDVSKQYVSYIFKGNSYRKLISEIAKGTNINNLKREHILNFGFPLPPKPIQQAIVSKIEELFSELDKGIENLHNAQQQLKTYRQSVLKWAFEGKFTNKNVKDGELPKVWKWLKFGGIFSESAQNGLYKPSTEYGSGTPIIRIDGFYDGIILSDYEYKRVRLSQEEINRYLISVGDILVNRVNSMPYLGKCGIVKHLKEKTVFESNIMKVRVKKEIAFPEYCTMYLSSKKGIAELRKNAKQAVNQASINQTDVSNVMIPIPPIEEQYNIIQAIESRLSVADKMEESIKQSLQQAEVLRQSILMKAFNGRLVS